MIYCNCEVQFNHFPALLSREVFLDISRAATVISLYLTKRKMSIEKLTFRKFCMFVLFFNSDKNVICAFCKRLLWCA